MHSCRVHASGRQSNFESHVTAQHVLLAAGSRIICISFFTLSRRSDESHTLQLQLCAVVLPASWTCHYSHQNPQKAVLLTKLSLLFLSSLIHVHTIIPFTLTGPAVQFASMSAPSKDVLCSGRLPGYKGNGSTHSSVWKIQCLASLNM